MAEGGIEIALKTKTLEFVDEVDTPKNTLVESPLCAFMQHSSLASRPGYSPLPWSFVQRLLTALGKVIMFRRSPHDLS
jgi:hypothetical protein